MSKARSLLGNQLINKVNINVHISSARIKDRIYDNVKSGQIVKSSGEELAKSIDQQQRNTGRDRVNWAVNFMIEMW